MTLGLTACGGGGGGSVDSAPVGTGPVAQRAVQGTAAKGLIKGAKVSLYALDAQGARAATALATATTGNDGTYKLQVPMSVLNFVIEVTAAPGAVMADEVTGADVPLAEGMKLRSIVTLADNATGTYEGTVSPLTEMVARTAETADGKLPLQAVAQAKIGVRTLLGFDPETVKPVNANSAAAATASEDEKNQSLALAAISKMASSVTADCGQSNPGERISCVVRQFAGSVSLANGQASFQQNRLAQFRDAIQAVVQDKNVNRTGKDKVGNIPVLTPGGSVPVGAPKTPVEAAKALFGSLRTNLQSLDQGDAFRSTADAVKADLDNVVAPLGNDAAGFATLIMTAQERLEQYRAGAPRVDFDVNWNRLMDYYHSGWDVTFGHGDGQCHITSSPLAINCTIFHSFLDQAAVGPYPYASVYAVRTFTLVPKADGTNAYTYTTALQRREAIYTYTGGKVVSSQPLGASFGGDVTVARTDASVTQLAIQGGMPGRVDGAGKFLSDREDWSLNVARAKQTDGTTLVTFGGAFTAYDAGSQALGKIEIDKSSFVRLAMDEGDAGFSQHSANALKVGLRGTVGTTTVGGTLSASGDQFDKSKTHRMPTSLSFEGSLKHQDATVFAGKVAITRKGYENFDATAPESDTNFVADSVELSGALSLPNRPTLSLTLGATRTGKDAADISAQYRDGSAVVNASVTAKTGERHPLVKISSADGVAFSFSDTSTPVPVTKDGVVVAQIDLAKGIITYRDGTTESLK